MSDTLQRHRTDPQKNLIGFLVGDVHYAVDIGRVREIVNPMHLTALPHTPPEVAGVVDHRGEVIPIIDLRVRFGLEKVEPSRSTKWILVGASDHAIGLVVDRMTEVFGTGGEELRPTPDVGGAHDIRGIMGVVSHNGMLTFVLDTERLLAIAASLAGAGAL